MSEMLEFKNAQIEALQREVEKLKLKLIETEKATTQTSRNLRDFINDPNFHKPILNENYK